MQILSTIFILCYLIFIPTPKGGRIECHCVEIIKPTVSVQSLKK